MKINLLKNAGSAKSEVRKMLKELAIQFAYEYDIIEKEAVFYALTDSTVRKEFCNYLNDNDILHVTIYRVTKSNGEDLACGFDIEEDSLYTAAILKYS